MLNIKDYIRLYATEVYIGPHIWYECTRGGDSAKSMQLLIRWRVVPGSKYTNKTTAPIHLTEPKIP